MKSLDEMTEPELAAVMTAAADGVTAALPPGTGFFVLAFGFHAPGVAQYVSNGRRRDLVKRLRETADRLERREEVGR